MGRYSAAAGGRSGESGEGWSASINARKKGGKLLGNMLQALLHKSLTPTQHLRKTLVATASYESAVTLLESDPQIDDSYFIVAGTKSGEGAVLARDRNKNVDTWKLNPNDPNEPNGWFRLQTNYDHWDPAPTADDRRTPGVAHMVAMGRDAVTTAAMWKVIKTWPSFNHHTDYSAVFVPARAEYNATVFMRP
uniref:Phospholipase B-like n=1 Tax=Haptolina brevifila TaxID=156173 RepID=A0A7S2D4W8_9EUKA|mmetsp:Transcript_33179/g.66014  ORF Transcript_33179/g.66014 Transcript_33179/m.66014 type:complete len:192 (+) Transcript_33179:115-690(+)